MEKQKHISLWGISKITFCAWCGQLSPASIPILSFAPSWPTASGKINTTFLWLLASKVSGCESCSANQRQKLDVSKRRVLSAPNCLCWQQGIMNRRFSCCRKWVHFPDFLLWDLRHYNSAGTEVELPSESVLYCSDNHLRRSTQKPTPSVLSLIIGTSLPALTYFYLKSQSGFYFLL